MKKKREKRNWMLCIVLLLMAFTLSVCTAQAYSYSDYYDEDEEDDDKLEYYDYHTGRWKVISEPDPVSYGYGGGSSSVIMMMPLFIIFFLIFFPWLAYSLVRIASGKLR